jgi:hypothetical protein
VGLLAKWTDFARAAVALPKDACGERWRSAVVPIISLQAITQALGELDLLAADERALALDRAEVQSRADAQALHAIWRGEEMPEAVIELIDDARLAVQSGRDAGVEWVVAQERMTAEHPGELVAALLSRGFAGDLYVPTPGVAMFETSPAVFARLANGAMPDDETIEMISEWFDGVGEPERVAGMRQAYRQFDFRVGRAVRDLVVPMRAPLPGGQPLLVCAIERGEARPVTLPPRKSAEIAPLPVVEGDDAARE